MTVNARTSRIVLVAVVLALPVVLIVHALLTARELREMKGAYLRSRAAAVAGRIETLPEDITEDARLDTASREEPALVSVRIFERQDAGPESASLAPLWDGRLLFQTGEAISNGETVFRAYVPFHSPAGLRIARIDLAATGADYLVTHARHNLALAVFVAVVLWTLAVYVLWASRRMAALERKQLELAHLAQIGRLSAVLAHEIRNPLGTIKGFVQLAAERADSGVSGLLDPLLQEVLRLERLVSDLLMFGRPRQPVTQTIRWQPLAQEVVAAANGAGGPVPIICTAEDWNLETDPELLKQVLLNLLRNAEEAAAGLEGAEVRVSAALRHGGFTIAIADSGPGLPAEVKAKLFEPFVTTKASGTGLGLSIAKRLTEALGGTLELRDNQPRGTVAELVFPGMKAAPNLDSAPWKPSL
jgi:two-component system, NtrC family, sensor histidine kinase HydH